MEDSLTKDLGPQPLDAILDGIGLSNHRLVALSTEQLTHKQVQKARKGRRISVNIQRKILRALNDFPGKGEESVRVVSRPEDGDDADASLTGKRIYELKELFNYRG